VKLGEDTSPPTSRERGSTGLSEARKFNLADMRDYGIVVAFVALFVTLSFASPIFLNSSNLLNILEQNVPVGLIAVGGTLVFVVGGFDISAGAVATFSGLIAAELADPIGVLPALVLGVLSGMALGMINGLLTTVGRINPLITTLSVSIILGGAAVSISGGKLIVPEDLNFSKLGQGQVGPVPYSVIVWLVIAVLFGVVLSASVFGRRVKAAGSSNEAARLAGVPVDLVRSACYAISGLCAGLGGVIIASRIGSASATGAGDYSLVFLAIAAIVVGGTSINGGEGAVWRTILGVLLLAMIGNGFNLLNVDPTYQEIIRGSIIIGAVAIDTWSKRTYA
jgi:ribose transport system permease protein